MAQEIKFLNENGVIISKPLTDEEWLKVKKNYVPDSLKYFTLTIIEYSAEELIYMQELSYRKTLIKNEMDSSTAYSKEYISISKDKLKKSMDKAHSKYIDLITKQYKGAFRIKKLSELDSTDRFLLETGYLILGDPESNGWITSSGLYFEDKKRKIVFPLILREPKNFYGKIL